MVDRVRDTFPIAGQMGVICHLLRLMAVLSSLLDVSYSSPQTADS